MTAPTHKTRADVRADVLADLLSRRCPLTVRDVYALPALRHWNAAAIGQAIDVLVSDGRLSDDGYGRLHIGEVAA